MIRDVRLGLTGLVAEINCNPGCVIQDGAANLNQGWLATCSIVSLIAGFFVNMPPRRSFASRVASLRSFMASRSSGMLTTFLLKTASSLL